MKRTILAKFDEWSKSKGRKPLLIYGARQIGKTYILLEFAKKHFSNYIYINFEKDKLVHADFNENLDPKEIINKLATRFNQTINPTTDLLIFDEIQECPRAITSLKYFCEDMPELKVMATGSLLGVKLVGVSFPVGKVDTLHMQPMSYEEFLQASGNEMLYEHFQAIPETKKIYAHDQLWDLFKHYLIVGGMPAAVQAFFDNKDDLLLNRINSTVAVQERILENYYADIGKHSGKENSMHISRILQNVPEQLAREADESSSKFKFKNVIPGKTKYSQLVSSIDWLEAVGLVHRIQVLHHIDQPLSAYTKENFFKLYLFDMGMLRALSGLDPRVILDFQFGTYKGYYAENFVLQELVYASAGREKFYAWNENKAEIEFIRSIKGEIVPIEVKSGNKTRGKSLKSYADKYKPKYMIILSGQELNLSPDELLQKYPLYLAAKVPF